MWETARRQQKLQSMLWEKKKYHYTYLLLFIFPVLFSFNVQEQLLKIRQTHLHQAFLAGLPVCK